MRYKGFKHDFCTYIDSCNLSEEAANRLRKKILLALKQIMDEREQKTLLIEEASKFSDATRGE